MKTKSVAAAFFGVIVLGLVFAVPLHAQFGDSQFGDGSKDGKMTVKPIESPALFDPQIRVLYQQALGLYRARRFDEAEAKCQQILNLRTNEMNAVQLLSEIAATRLRVPAADPAGAMRQKLKDLILPELRTVDAAARDVVFHLQAITGKITADKVPLNLVWAVRQGVSLRPVNLTLYDVSVADALSLLASATALSYRVDPNAVVIYQPGAGAPTVSAGASTEIQRQLEQTLIPEYRLTDAHPRAALEYLQQLVRQHASDKTPMGLAWNVPTETEMPSITMALYNLSAADILKYWAEVAGLVYRVDQHAVLISLPAISAMAPTGQSGP